jgi:tRNA1Val (adenine37-N6)-methyltransferase
VSKRNPNQFRFKQFSIVQEKSAMKVGIDSVLLGAWTKTPEEGNFLDIGTGTGILALMMAQRTACEIDAIEIDQDAFEEACLNASNSPWAGRINVFNSSLQNFETNKTYELIICNPPFYKNSFPSNKQNRKTARSHKELDLETLFKNSRRLLADNGSLSIVYPFQFMDEIIQLAAVNKFYIARICKVKPNPNKDFHRVMLEVCKQKSEVIEEELIIENQHLDYTKEFRELTKNFYIKY